MTNPGGTPSTPSRLLRNSTTKATDHELQKYDNFTRYGHSRQQAERTMTTSILKVARKGRIDAWHGRQIRLLRRDRLDSGLLVVGDDRHPLARFLRPGGALLQDLDLAIDTQDLRHFLLELGIATLQIVAHLVRLDFLLAENLAHCALDQVGKALVSRRRAMLTRMAGQPPRC